MTDDVLTNNLDSLDQKVNSILEFLNVSQSKNEDNTTRFTSLFQDNMSDEQKEKNSYSRLRRKQRIYQAVPVNLDSINDEVLAQLGRVLKTVLPKPPKIETRIAKKESSWISDLLKVLGALASGLGVLELLKDYLVSGGSKGKIINAVKEATEAAAKAGEGSKGKIINAVKEATEAAEKAGEAAAKASENVAEIVPKKPVTRVTDPLTEALRNGEPIEVTIKNLVIGSATTDPKALAFKEAFDEAIKGKKINVDEMLGSMKELDYAKKIELLAKSEDEFLYKNILQLDSILDNIDKPDSMYRQLTATLKDLKEHGYRPEDIRELVKVKTSIIEDIIQATKELPEYVKSSGKEIIRDLVGGVGMEEDVKFEEQWAKATSWLRENTLGRVENLKGLLQESKGVRNIAGAASKAIPIIEGAMHSLAQLGISYETYQANQRQVERGEITAKNKYEKGMEALGEGVVNFYSFGILGAEDAQGTVAKQLKKWQDLYYKEDKTLEETLKTYANLILQIPDATNKFIFGSAEHLARYTPFLKDPAAADRLKERFDADLTEQVFELGNTAGEIMGEQIQESYEKGIPSPWENMQQDFLSRPGQRPIPFSPNDNIIGVKDLKTLRGGSEETVQTLKALMTVVEKTNKTVDRQLAESSAMTKQVANEINTLARALADQTTKSSNFVNNSKNLTNITISPTTSKSYRESR
jgi:hypothetical protein